MTISNHASKRLQQRGISKEMAELILTYGECYTKPGGVTEYRLTPKAKTLAQAELKRQWLLIEKACNKGVLVDEMDDKIISVYHIMKPVYNA